MNGGSQERRSWKTVVYSDTKKIIILSADLPLQNKNNILGINEEKLLASKPDEPEHCIFTKRTRCVLEASFCRRSYWCFSWLAAFCGSNMLWSHY